MKPFVSEDGSLPSHLESPIRPIKRILYSEDDSLIRKLTAFWLMNAGYGVTAVEDGYEAIEALACNRFDLLITDLVTPRVHGLELITHVRREHTPLPVIVTTGCFQAVHQSEYESLDVQSWVQKPFGRLVLLESIERTLGLSRTTRGSKESATA